MNRTHTQRMGAVLALSLLASGAAKAELVNIAWNGAGHFEKTVSVNPGKFAEVCGKLTKGQVIVWSFTSSAAMNFNIHYHEGKSVVFPSKLDAVAAGEDKLLVPLDQGYCWMWSNKTDKPVELKLMLQK